MTRRGVIVLLCGLVSLAAILAVAQRRSLRGRAQGDLPLANSDAERKVLPVIDEMRRTGGTYLSVEVSDGRMMRLLVEATGAKNVVEIGTSTGFSGLWFCLGLLRTGGKLTTFEYDAGRAAAARANFRKAGVDVLATVVQGDAHRTISQVAGPVDMVFLDADKEGYLDYLNKMLPLVRPGGLILAHNVDSAGGYVRAITANPALETLFNVTSGGLAVTLKKR